MWAVIFINYIRIRWPYIFHEPNTSHSIDEQYKFSSKPIRIFAITIEWTIQLRKYLKHAVISLIAVTTATPIKLVIE